MMTPEECAVGKAIAESAAQLYQDRVISEATLQFINVLQAGWIDEASGG